MSILKCPSILLYRFFLFTSLAGLFFCQPISSYANFQKVNTNPVFSTIPNTWESHFVGNFSILNENNKLKIWYGASDSTNEQLGYTETFDPLNITRLNQNPILPWNFVSNLDIGVEQPSILHVKNLNGNLIYEMWFNNAYPNSPNFEIYYSTSSDGIVWNAPIKAVFNNLTDWDSTGIGGATVLYSESEHKYKMWYVGRGNYNNSGVKWRIGYATSTDGVNWDKNLQPVLDSSQSWENKGDNSGLGNGNVLFENNTYHMFYHADKDIGYASSPDGINWTKYDNNPILTPSTDDLAFDTFRILKPYILKFNNTYYLYYMGFKNFDKFDTGLATSTILPGQPETTSTPSPTTTPTPTNTPVPTSTPLPTPSPIPLSSFPIIILPGMGGSWNAGDIFSCNLSTGSEWTATPFVNVYDNLLDTLTKKAKLKRDKDVYFYTYDWRQSLSVQSTRLKKYIDTVLAGRPGLKVRLIGHSYGGLVIRSYLNEYWADDKAAMAMTLGTPHRGTLYAYPLWEKGKLPHENSPFNIALNLMIQYCQTDPVTFKSQSARKVVQNLAPAVADILPIFNYIYRKGNIVDIADMYYKNTWLLAHEFPQSHFFIPFETLSGSGVKTLLSYTVKDPTNKELLAGDWRDGKPDDSSMTKDGDGTVLYDSASIQGIIDHPINKNHNQIVSSKEGIRQILKFLQINVDPVEDMTQSASSQKMLSVSLSKPLDFVISAPNTQGNSDKQLGVLYNPSSGNYKIKIKGKKDENAKMIVSYLDENNDEQNSIVDVKLNKNKTTELNFQYSPGSQLPSSLKSVQY